MKRYLFLTLAFIALGCSSVQTANASGWTQVYGDYYASDNDKVIGIEGGKYGVYGFLENNTTKQTTFAKASYHSEVAQGLTIYSQGSYFVADGFREHQAYLGLGFKALQGNNWALAPWVAYGLYDNTFDHGYRGLLGWTGNIQLDNNKSIYTWTEVGLDKRSLNGAIGFQQEFTKNLYGALQYRYMYNDAGVDGYGDEAMIRIGYKFN